MAGQIVLFGATGYTGRLTAAALIERGVRPVLAGRSAEKLRALAAELGEELEVRTADVDRPETVRGLVSRGDVLLTTVGPFARWGAPAVQAAIAAGAHYLDSTGEPEFIRAVFERYGDGAKAAGCGLVTAFGYDYVPGNLAGGLALDRAGRGVARVDVGYYMTGKPSRDAMSGGTLASLAGAVVGQGFGWRGGRLVNERNAARTRSFSVDGKRLGAVSIASSEHFALPRLYPSLRDVNAYLGWFGPLSSAMSAVSGANELARRVPGVGRAQSSLLERTLKGSTGGPDATARAKTGSHVIGATYDAGGGELSHVVLTGPNGYSFTADILAWGATAMLDGGLQGTGALGPVDGFGLEALREGCANAGLIVAP